jgi:ABC-type transport system involved in multi-copper enzyme maturation permease subunit
MKALIQKELRENLKLAVLSLVVFTLLVVGHYRYYAGMMEDVALGFRSAGTFLLQPLTSQFFLGQAGLLCALFGAVLGWMQIYNEKHRDLWAFLVHRPVTRTEIFFSKIIAGLVIYLAAAGLPLAGFAAWTVVPGNIAAPFEWRMLLPLATHFFGGVFYYFAGMLTGLRQARWYASRGLGLALAVLVSAAMANWPSDRLRNVIFTSIFILASLFILVAAVWGGFQSNGHYRNQPALGKSGLTAVLTLGAGVVAFFVVVMLMSSIPNRIASSGPRRSFYTMTKNGTICKGSNGGGQPFEYVDLNGEPVKDPKTGNKVTQDEFSQLVANNFSINVKFREQRSISWDPQNLFTFWQETPHTLWFYWKRYGRFVGYDTRTRRCIGSVGPDGFSTDLAGGGDRLRSPMNDYNYWDSGPRHIIRTATAVYQTDLQNRALKPLFTAANGDTIGGVKEVSLKGDWNYTVVVTKQFVHLVTPDGKVIWKAPYEPDSVHKNVSVYFLETADQFALWFSPTYPANEKAGWKLPTHVTWFARDQGALKSTDLPALPPGSEYLFIEKFASALAPPGLWVFPLLVEQNWPPKMTKLLLISLTAALVIWVPAGWGLGRRYHFTAAAQLGWAAFHLVCGLPGFLAFLSVQEWPARESCPNCKKLRTVDREKCEHCGADFAPPEKNGTEIFAPLTAVK